VVIEHFRPFSFSLSPPLRPLLREHGIEFCGGQGTIEKHQAHSTRLVVPSFYLFIYLFCNGNQGGHGHKRPQVLVVT